MSVTMTDEEYNDFVGKIILVTRRVERAQRVKTWLEIALGFAIAAAIIGWTR